MADLVGDGAGEGLVAVGLGAGAWLGVAAGLVGAGLVGEGMVGAGLGEAVAVALPAGVALALVVATVSATVIIPGQRFGAFVNVA